jgi:uncharacterized protein (DUF3820 family)
MGLIDNVHMPFGIFGPGADYRVIGDVPSSYLRWCLEQDWFERKYESLVEPFEEELAWRDRYDMHFNDVKEVRY